MATLAYPKTPDGRSYDVVIIGGAIMGSSTAWWLTNNPDFDGTVLVIDRDTSFAMCSTAHTNSCIRQQFSHPLNIKISQFTAEFIKSLRENMGGDERIPDLSIQNFGYLYLSDNEKFSDILRNNQAIQNAAGAETELLSPSEILARYPFYNLEDIQLGSMNRKDEGYWDGGTLFEWFRRKAREQGAIYIENEVTGISTENGRAAEITLASGEKISCGAVVNAAGPRASLIAAMVGIDIPVEPRKRYSWIFSTEGDLGQALPLTIDPCGVHMRQDGPNTFLTGCPSDPDPAVDPTDFTIPSDVFEDRVWPVIANRVPIFERLRIVTQWAGHYAFNTLDQNAILGPHPEIENLYFINGFSGHGLQQSAAMGRGLAELLTTGTYQTLDLSPFAFERILTNTPIPEAAVI